MVWTEEALGFGYTAKAWGKPDDSICLPPTDQRDEVVMANNDAAVEDEEMGSP